LEVELLLRHLLGLDRTGLYTSLERRLTPEQTAAFSALIRRRINHEPTAYITGHKEFFGLDFQVAPPVLIPRPETELLVEQAIDLAATIFPRSCLIADIGTGCGAIAIALAINLPRAKIYATDISDAALEIARSNCQRFGASDRITFLRSNLTDSLPESMHLIVANLPYVRESEIAELSPEISEFEPLLALNGGADGLEMIEKLISQAERNLLRGGAVLLEIGHDQGQAVCNLARSHFPESKVSITADLSGLDRVVSIISSR
jgi:release factor glutamine methyltransferase